MPRQSEKKRESDKKCNSNRNRRRRKDNNKVKKKSLKFRLQSSDNKILENVLKKRSQTCGKNDKRVRRNRRAVNDAQVQTFPIVIVVSDNESIGEVLCQEKEQLKFNLNDGTSAAEKNIKDVWDMNTIVAQIHKKNTNVNSFGCNESRCLIANTFITTLSEEIDQSEVLEEIGLVASTANDVDNECISNSAGNVENDCVIDESKTPNNGNDMQYESDESNPQEESKSMVMEEMQQMDLTDEPQNMIQNSSNTMENIDMFLFGNKVVRDNSTGSDFLTSYTFGSKNEYCAQTNSLNNQHSNDSDVNNCTYEIETPTDYPGIFTENGQAFYDSKHGAYVEPNVINVEGGSSAPKQSMLSWCSIKNMFVRGIYSQEQDIPKE